jgi:Tfp pilus assembly protein PilF
MLSMQEPAQALKEYETSLQAARNRYRGFYGPAKAAQQLGDKEKAKGYYEKMLALCTQGGGIERREVAEAKTYLAKK